MILILATIKFKKSNRPSWSTFIFDVVVIDISVRILRDGFVEWASVRGMKEKMKKGGGNSKHNVIECFFKLYFRPI